MRSSSRVVIALVSCLIAGIAAAPAAADGPVLGADGETAATYDLTQATRQRVYIPQPGIDQDGDGQADRVYLEIERPQESGPTNQVPAIIDPSPYYSTVCRGNETQCEGDVDGDGRNDKWPLFLDNYFVPRGYAYILAESNGTGHSTGCPLHGGPGDVAGMKSVIDWLQGRVPGYDASTDQPVVADWHNGKAAMIGKSYDGTLANAVAATGVAGLTTIVSESAISDWYDYSRMGGIRFNTHYPSSLSSAITNDGTKQPEFPSRLSVCAPSRTQMNADDGDADGDINPFWNARDYYSHVDNVHAAVFSVHGLQDDNVRVNHLAQWWQGLKDDGVPRKLWLTRLGHVDPFDARRAVWVDTLHRWFDHWLYGVGNGIMDEPPVTIEDGPGTWNDYPDWPLPDTTTVPMYLRGTSPSSAGDLSLRPDGTLPTVGWTDASQSETTMISNPEGQQTSRRVFLSPPLNRPLRISGTPSIDLRAALDKSQTNLGAILVDYGAGTQITRSGDGISNTTTRTCWGQNSGITGDYDACYLEVTQPTQNVTQWRVTKGILDSSNRNSLQSGAAAAAVPGTQYDFRWPLLPQDYVFAAGHRIGLVLVANYTGYASVAGTTGTTITMDAIDSALRLPVVGGYDAAAASGAFGREDTPPVLHDMPRDVATTSSDREGRAVTYDQPTATDNEDPSPGVACAPASGSTFAIGTTTVTCTATDAFGNSASKTFTVRVDYDGPAPAPEPVTAGPAAPALTPYSARPSSVTAPKALALSRVLISRTGVVTATVQAPGKGRVSARTLLGGRRLGSAARTSTRSGVLHLRVVPSASARRRFLAHPGATIRLTLTFKPAKGKAKTITQTLRRSKARATPAPRTADGQLIPY